MSLSRPIWSPHVAGLLIRVPIGLYFVLAGRMKLQDINGFVDAVRAFDILPNQLATLYGILLPYLEILTGALLIVGIWTTFTALLASALLASFIYALGLLGTNPQLFNKDIILLCGTLSLLSSGAGALSIDNFRMKG